jgi:hypothetical protein
MVDAAIAMEAFDAGLSNAPAMTHPDWNSYPERLYASEWYDLWPHDGRSCLTWRGRFENVPRLTELYNFYSSGEEVLENPVLGANCDMLDLVRYKDELGSRTAPIAGQNAWNLQELMKGRMSPWSIAAMYLKSAADHPNVLLGWYLWQVHTGDVLGSQHGGWGFNPVWDSEGTWRTLNEGGVLVQLYTPGSHQMPGDASALPDSELKANPFCLPFSDPGLYQPAGGTMALANQSTFLAQDVPARTFAVGANALVRKNLSQIPAQNINLNSSDLKRGWPEKRIDSAKKDRWLHSDLHDVPYQYSGLVVNKWLRLGGE